MERKLVAEGGNRVYDIFKLIFKQKAFYLTILQRYRKWLWCDGWVVVIVCLFILDVEFWY